MDNRDSFIVSKLFKRAEHGGRRPEGKSEIRRLKLSAVAGGFRQKPVTCQFPDQQAGVFTPAAILVSIFIPRTFLTAPNFSSTTLKVKNKFKAIKRIQPRDASGFPSKVAHQNDRHNK